MQAQTAKSLAPREPFVVIRSLPAAVLKYQVDRTGFSRPENVIWVSSANAPKGVAVREEFCSTGGSPVSLID
jgi:hypothetical protein